MHGDDGYGSPEEAARGDIPEQYARPLFVAVSPDGRQAFVLLATNEEPSVELYEVVCYREGDRWFFGGGSGGLGGGWSSTSVDDDGNPLGVLWLVGEVAEGVEAVIVRSKGREHEVPVSGEYFFFTEWNVSDDFSFAEVVRYVRSDGSEEPVPIDVRTHEWLSEMRRGQTPDGRLEWGWEVRREHEPNDRLE